MEESIQGTGVCKGPEVGKDVKETSEEAGAANEEAPRGEQWGRRKNRWTRDTQ